PSLVCPPVLVLVLGFRLKKKGLKSPDALHSPTDVKDGRLTLFLGTGALISIPVFITLTHLLPSLARVFGLGVLWVVSELLHSDLEDVAKKNYTVAGALSRVDVPSVLFFLGILLAVGSLESMQILNQFASYLDRTLGDQRTIITLIGMLS